MCLRGVPRDRAARASAALSGAAGLALLGWGLYQSVQLRMLTTTVFIGGWICREAYGVAKMVQAGTIASHPMFSNYDS